MRVRGFALFTALIAVVAFSPVNAAAIGIDNTITVAVTEDIPNTIDKVVFHALSELGYNVRIHSNSMVSAMAAVSGGETDLLAFQVTPVADEYPNLIRVPESITTKEFCVYTKADNNETVRDWAELSGKRVGLAYQRPYSESKIPDDAAAVVRLPNEPMLFDGLLNGDFDYAVLSRIGDEELNPPDGVKLMSVLEKQDAYTFVNKNNAWLVLRLSDQYRKMKTDGTMEQILSRTQTVVDGGIPDILHISSYNADMAMEKELKQGFLDVLNVKAYNLFSYNLDSKRYFNDPKRNQSLLNIIRSDFIDRDPDIIMVSGDDAFELVKEYYLQLFKGIPVVMCGVSDFAAAQFGEFGVYFTGVTQEISADKTAELILKLLPGTENLYIINGHSGTDLTWRGEIERQLEPFKDRLNVAFSPDVPMPELLNDIAALPSGTVILSGAYFTDSNGKYYLQNESQALFSSAASVPIFGLMGTNVGYGQVGGRCVDAYNQGKFAGGVALRLLDGESPLDIIVEENSESLNRWVFDAGVLSKWDISMAELPEESSVINQKQSILQTNPTEFALLMALIFGALIAIIALLNMTNELSKKNKLLHTTEELLAKDAEMHELNRRSQQIISSAPLGFTLTKDDVITEINSYAEKQFGLQRGDRLISAFANVEAHGEMVNVLNDFGYFQSAVNTLITANGELSRFFTSGSTIDGKDGTEHANWVMDIEDLERKKDEIKRAREDFEKIIMALPIPVVLIDAESFEIIYCNQQFISLFGFESVQHALGFSYYDLFPEKQPDGSESRLEIDENIRQINESSELYTWERVFRLLNGENIEAQTAGGSIIYNNRSAIIIIARDVTAEKKQQRMLESITEKEKESNVMKSRFLVNMSHEIRTPMNAIIGFSEIALRKTQDHEFADTLSKINSSAKILLNIINDILDFSKIEAEKLDFVDDEFELEEVLSNAMMVSAQRINGRPVEMLLKVAPDVPFRVIGDKTRIWQVLKNFLDNSAKFTEKGHVLCSVYLCGSNSEKVQVGFSVSDTGVGVSKANLERIFVPFEQFGKTWQMKQEGTGLGMSISSKLIEMMGGSIDIKSKEGEGTTIDFVIPFALPQKHVYFGEMCANSGLNGANIMLVSNDMVTCDIIETLLSDAGAAYVSTDSGEDAVRRYKQADLRGEAFDIVILDYRKRGMDGIKIAKELRPLFGDNTKLILVSSYIGQLTDAVLASGGITDVIEKPFGPTVFYNKLMSVMGVKTVKKVDSGDEKLLFTGSRVLLCEDNYINQEVAIGMLEEYDIEVVVAENGRVALEILEEQEFDLIFMDILMPEMDGHAAAAAIRGSDKPFRDIPIVAMTANVMQDEIKKCMDEGMNGYVAKPIEYEKLKAKLIKWLTKPPVTDGNSGDNGGCEFPRINGLDTAKGLASFGGKKDRYAAAIKQFLDIHGEKHISFESAVSSGNIKHLLNRMRDMMDSSAKIGAENIHKAAREFNNQIRMNVPDIIQYEKLNDYIKELRAAVDDAALGDKEE